MESITLERDGNDLVIRLGSCSGPAPVATIQSGSGTRVEQFRLRAGEQRIGVRPYTGKNYSIRIINGKDELTQYI